MDEPTESAEPESMPTGILWFAGVAIVILGIVATIICITSP